tara:strand:- start:508 stop:975 length:468 start_codon:yes stop_codon:yes gene_type:complete
MKDDKIDLEKISKKDLLRELRLHMMSFNKRMGEIKSPHKLLEVLLTYVVCVTYDVLQESTNEATMLIGASWGRVINDIAREKGMTRKEVFFQADMLGNLAGGANTDWNSIIEYGKDQGLIDEDYVIDPEELEELDEKEVLDAVKLQMESKNKTKH